MQSFTDTDGRTWSLSLNVSTLKRVKEGTGVLLTSIADDKCKLLAELASDYILLVNVLWCMCEKQAEALDVDEEGFASALGGDALGNAHEALVRAIIDFFTNPEARRTLTTVVEKTKAIGEAAQKMGVDRIEEILSQMNTEQVARSFLDSVTNSQPSQEPTPTAALSAS